MSRLIRRRASITRLLYGMRQRAMCMSLILIPSSRDTFIQTTFGGLCKIVHCSLFWLDWHLLRFLLVGGSFLRYLFCRFLGQGGFGSDVTNNAIFFVSVSRTFTRFRCIDELNHNAMLFVKMDEASPKLVTYAKIHNY
jgi:hypothetical protein